VIGGKIKAITITISKGIFARLLALDVSKAVLVGTGENLMNSNQFIIFNNSGFTDN
jgi:hypothetical protein